MSFGFTSNTSVPRICYLLCLAHFPLHWALLVAQVAMNPPAMQETRVQSPQYPGLIQREPPFRNGAECIVTNLSVYTMCSTWFSLFKNWGFHSWRGKMKVNILSCFTWNVVIAIHWSQCHSKLGLRLTLVTHPIEVEEVDSTKLAENLQIVVSVILRAGKMVWDRRDPGWAVVTFWTLLSLCLLTFHLEKF